LAATWVPTLMVDMLAIGMVREGVVTTRRSILSAVNVFVAAALSVMRPENIIL
jgi:hypothetical protein